MMTTTMSSRKNTRMNNLPSYQHAPAVTTFADTVGITSATATRFGGWQRLLFLGCGAILLTTWASHVNFPTSQPTMSILAADETASSSVLLLGKSKDNSDSEDCKGKCKRQSTEAASSDSSHERHEAKKQAKAKRKQEKQDEKQQEKEEKKRKKEEGKEVKQEEKAKAKEKKEQKKEEAKEAKEAKEEKERKKADKPPHQHYPFSLFKSLMDLDSKIDGDIYFPWNWTEWKDVKHVWNMIAKSPLVVIQVEHEKDVQLTVPLLAELEVNYSFPFRIASGGHNYAGYSSAAGGATLSLSRMNSTSLSDFNDDAGTAIATVGPATTVQNVLDDILIPHGYSGVLGLCGGVAESGFALNGGFGYLSRLYGLGLDSVHSLRIVMADGSVETASATKNPELFFALRGAGGGNFGVVTEIQYFMHKSQDTQLTGTASMAYEDLGSFFQVLGENDKDIPGEMMAYFETADGPEVLVSWFGPNALSLEAGKKYLEEDIPAMMPFNVTVEVEPVSWTESTRAAGNLEGHLVQAWTGFLYADNNTLVTWNDIMNTVLAGIEASEYLIPDIEQWGGAIDSTASSATAFPHRDALFNVGVLLMVPKSLANATEVYEDEVKKVSVWWPSVARYTEGVYLNYQMESLNATEYPRQYWGANLDRLIALKNKYDPKNSFNFPQSLPLAA